MKRTLLVSIVALSVSACAGVSNTGGLVFERRPLLRHASPGAYAIPKLLVTARGTVLVAAQDRAGGDWGKPIDPILVRSTDGGATWSEPALLYREEGPQRFHVKPTSIVEDRRNGHIVVFLVRSPLVTDAGEPIGEKWFYENLQETRRLGRAWFVTTSDDEGATWSEPRDVTAQLIREPHWQEWSPVHVGIQLREGPHRGRLVVPVRAYCPERDPSEHDPVHQRNGLLYSDDGGVTWIPGALSQKYLGECSLVELPGGEIYVNHRRTSGRGNARSYSVSRDGGVSFYEHGQHDDLPDQLCHAGLTRTDDGVLLLSNVPGPRREGLRISISRDGGRSWSPGRTLEPGPAAYSSLATRDGLILCVYETGIDTSRRDLALARFPLSWVVDGDGSTASPSYDGR